MADFGISEAAYAYTALAATAVSAGVSAVAAEQQGRAQAAAMQYQAQVARNNQEIASQYATMEVEKGQRLEDMKREQTAQAEGNMRAIAGAGNLDLASGSPLRLQGDIAKVGEMDALTIRANAQKAAYGYAVEGMNYAARAGLDEMGARDAARSGALGAFASIIGGASGVSGKWARFRHDGIFG